MLQAQAAPVAPAALVAPVREEMLPRVKAQQVSLVITVPQSCPTVMSTPAQHEAAAALLETDLAEMAAQAARAATAALHMVGPTLVLPSAVMYRLAAESMSQ